MLKPTLQLRLGQQLTMTPQLQQAIRLLQLPALDLQAHIREALENNVMLESLDEVPETATGSFEVTATDKPPQTAEGRETEPAAEVEIADASGHVVARTGSRVQIEGGYTGGAFFACGYVLNR